MCEGPRDRSNELLRKYNGARRTGVPMKSICLIGSDWFVNGEPMIEVRHPPGNLIDQTRHPGHLGEIDLIDSVSGFVIVHMHAVKEKDDGNTVLGVIPMVRAEINAVR